MKDATCIGIWAGGLILRPAHPAALERARLALEYGKARVIRGEMEVSDSPKVGNGLYNGLVVSWLFDCSDARLQRPRVDFVKLSSPHVSRALPDLSKKQQL